MILPVFLIYHRIIWYCNIRFPLGYRSGLAGIPFQKSFLILYFGRSARLSFFGFPLFLLEVYTEFVEVFQAPLIGFELTPNVSGGRLSISIRAINFVHLSLLTFKTVYFFNSIWSSYNTAISFGRARSYIFTFLHYYPCSL